MKKFYLPALILAMVSSCIYPYDPDLEDRSDEVVVIEGSIVIGGNATARLSKMSPLSGSATPAYVTGTVTVEDDGGNVYASSAGPGQTVTIPMKDASPDGKYRMRAVVDGKEYVSDWMTALSPPEIKSVSFTADDDLVYVTASLDGGKDPTGYLALSFEETWEFHVDFICWYQLDTMNWKMSRRNEMYPNYWCWKTESSKVTTLVDYSEMEGNRVESFPVRQFSRFDNRNHRKYSINIKAFTLPKETYRYLKNMNEHSSGGGSLFTPNPGEMVSNVRCESDPGQAVVGYVTAALVSSHREFIGDEYFKYVAPQLTSLVIPRESEFMYYYHQGYYPIDNMVFDFGDGNVQTGTAWGPLRCIDCVVAGGTREKPDFWK